MSFIYGTNAELLYSMPAIGGTLATNASKQIVSATTATNPPFFLPPLYNIWSPSQMPGKALHFEAAGGYDFTAANVTMQLYFDTAFSSATTVIAQTGAAAWAASTVGMWSLDCDLTCVSSGQSVSTWYVSGAIVVGPSNSPTAIGSAFTFGNAVTAGIPQAVTLIPGTSYCPEIYVTVSAGITAFVCTQFQVWALN
jgi:hypothetical protein